jgi:hypothetical protein
VQVGTQLHAVLQRRSGPVAGGAIPRAGQGKAQKDRLGYRRLLVDDAARPIIISSVAANCWQPYVRNYTPHDNSQYNSLRFEEVWLDK